MQTMESPRAAEPVMPNFTAKELQSLLVGGAQSSCHSCRSCQRSWMAPKPRIPRSFLGVAGNSGFRGADSAPIRSKMELLAGAEHGHGLNEALDHQTASSGLHGACSSFRCRSLGRHLVAGDFPPPFVRPRSVRDFPPPEWKQFNHV